jgi:hypothetical protein
MGGPIVRHSRAAIAIGFVTTMFSANLAEARITEIEIIKSEPAFSGETFGEVAAFEHLVGRVAGELDPADPANAITAEPPVFAQRRQGASA